MAVPDGGTRWFSRLPPTIGAAALAVLLAGCDLPRLGAPNPASEEGEHVASLWSGFLLAAGAVTLFIWVLLGWVIIRYRRRDRDTIPNQRAYNIPIEIAYTLVPVLIVAVLFTCSVLVERKVTAVAKDPAATVEVVGFQWGWRYVYPDFAIEAPPGEDPVLVLPLGEPSNLHLVSVDVAHSFWVPDFLNKRDLIPGVDNTVTVRPTRVGTFVGRCAEFCGLDHWRMQFQVKVVTPEDYQRWYDEHAAKGTGTGYGGGSATTTTLPASGNAPTSTEGAGS